MEQTPQRKTLTAKDIIYWWVVSTLVFTELSIILFMFLIFCPVPIQKAEKVIMDQVCSYGIHKYEYSFPKDNLSYYIVEDNIKQLNYRIGFDLFTRSKASTNVITVIPEIKGTYSLLTFFMRGETIGLTYCTKMCCGVDNYQVEFSESEFYDPIRTKLLIWHELGHVIGLNHDDSRPDVMNSFILESYKYNGEIEDRYINKIKERMGIK